MIKITIRGKASTDYNNLEELNSIDCQDDFTNYFGHNQTSLWQKGVKNGYAEFVYKDDRLWVETTYEANEELTPEELKLLEEYTQGQWSDGIGEKFKQKPCYYGDDNEESLFG